MKKSKELVRELATLFNLYFVFLSKKHIKKKINGYVVVLRTSSHKATLLGEGNKHDDMRHVPR